MSDETLKNSGVKFSLDLDLSELMIVADALSIAGNTALMSPNGSNSKSRLYELREQILDLLPIPKRHNRDGGYVWFEAMNALKKSNHYDVFIQETRTLSSDHYQIIVEADTKRFLITNEGITKEEAEAAILTFEDLFERYTSSNSTKLKPMDEIDVFIELEKSSYDFNIDRPFVQKAFNELLNNDNIHARVRFGQNNYSKKIDDDKYLYTIKISAPKHQHDLIKEICDKHIEDLTNENTSTPKM